MNHTTLVLVAVLAAAALVVGVFGTQLVQPASAQQCASSAASATGSASSSSEAVKEGNNRSCSTTVEASPGD
jgi:hypothetical protein